MIRKRLTSIFGALLAVLAITPCAMADMNGIDISNWQCGMNVASVQADFVIVGTTWGTGGVSNVCLVNGVNTDADRMLNDAYNSGKKIGVYHYARGGNPEEEARFFVNKNRSRVGKAMLILDWEARDNAAWGDVQWPRRWATEVKRLTGVNPVIYTMDSGYWQVSGMPQSHNTGLWIAQYASNAPTGYQSVPWRLGTRGEAMRQYTSNGRVGGYAGRLDLDIFRGDRVAWDKYANPNGNASPQATKPAPSPTNTAATNTCANDCVVVKSGDTVSLYWSDYWNVTVPSGNPNVIYPGQTICHRGASVPHATYNVRRHVVVSGETLGVIARANGISVYSIRGYRSGNINLIYPGEVVYW